MTVTARDFVNFGVITVFFTLEAIIHYSIGKSSGKTGTGWIHVSFPPPLDLIKILLVVLIFAALSSVATALIEKGLDKD